MPQKEKEPGSNLEAARISRLPSDAFYIPGFITEAEEANLLQKVYIIRPPPPLENPLQTPSPNLPFFPDKLQHTALLPAALLANHPIITPHFTALNLFADSPHNAPNHVLVNEYQPGQGIMPHEDGAAYHPLVATVSLGGEIVLDLYEKGNDRDSGNENEQVRQPKYRILQERRSLLVTRDGLYMDYLHGIAERDRDEGLAPDSICNWELLGEPERFRAGWYMRDTRVSLTYRDVLKVAKVGNTMKFLNRNI